MWTITGRATVSRVIDSIVVKLGLSKGVGKIIFIDHKRVIMEEVTHQPADEKIRNDFYEGKSKGKGW